MLAVAFTNAPPSLYVVIGRLTAHYIAHVCALVFPGVAEYNEIAAVAPNHVAQKPTSGSR